MCLYTYCVAFNIYTHTRIVQIYAIKTYIGVTSVIWACILSACAPNNWPNQISHPNTAHIHLTLFALCVSMLRYCIRSCALCSGSEQQLEEVNFQWSIGKKHYFRGERLIFFFRSLFSLFKFISNSFQWNKIQPSFLIFFIALNIFKLLEMFLYFKITLVI